MLYQIDVFVFMVILWNTFMTVINVWVSSVCYASILILKPTSHSQETERSLPAYTDRIFSHIDALKLICNSLTLIPGALSTKTTHLSLCSYLIVFLPEKNIALKFAIHRVQIKFEKK